MKYIILVPDGVADEPVAELGGKTPLEAANTPHMDRMAREGLSGLVKIIPDGLPPGSDIGNMSVLGYDPAKGFTGRSPLEAANLGINLKDDELAFRCNLVTVKNNTMIDYSAGHISIEDAAGIMATIAEKLNDNQAKFYTGKSYRHIMVLKTKELAKFQTITCTPPHDIMDKKIDQYLPQGLGREVLEEYVRMANPILASHPINKARIARGEGPANMLWFWGQGARPKLELYKDKFGISGSIISAVDLVNGIGRLIGLDIISVPGATGYYDTNYQGKGDHAVASLKNKDFIYVHVEATDEAGHNGDAKEKVRAVENFDKYVVGTVLEAFKGRDDFRILVTPDHPTPIIKRTHTRAPVPFVMFGKNIERNGASGYNESSAGRIGIIFESGEAMIKQFMSLKG
ncbi:MAG: cofactor-independent phosphoglycerate mutase [Candidatus Omnitrophica bacterium]|nr:cofactor-independent phosphoglycerate mutase [Candidatus Omnitrophota bacterium]